MTTPILFILPYPCSLWSLHTLKTFLIPVVFVVSLDFMHSSCVFMLNGCFYNIDHFSSMFTWPLFFSSIPWSFICIVQSCVSLLLSSLHETVVLVLIESHGSILCQVEVLCLIFALLRNLQSLTVPSALVGIHNQ